MTTPKRYEEMAAKRKWPDSHDTKAAELTLSFKNPDSFYTSDMVKVAEALRTAAKGAQLRVLDEYRSRMTREPRCQRANDEAMIAAARVLAELRAAIERGEDV